MNNVYIVMWESRESGQGYSPFTKPVKAFADHILASQYASDYTKKSGGWNERFWVEAMNVVHVEGEA